MFGGDLNPPTKPTRRKKALSIQDIQCVGVHPGQYGHVGREPNTDYHIRLLHYKQKTEDDAKRRSELEWKKHMMNAGQLQANKHTEIVSFRRAVEKGVKEKMEVYEESIEVRRNKLREILDLEEREYYREVVDTALRGGETRLEENKRRVEELKAQRERERNELVQQKRQQQLFERCIEVRPHMSKKLVMETKKTQLQQMRENEARREAEREMDKMWYDVMVKDIQAKAEREEQDAIRKHLNDNETVAILEMQIKGKELMKEEEKRTKLEDAEEMDKLRERIRREEIEALDERRRQRDATDKELQEQIAVQRQLLKMRQEEEKALDEAFILLTNLEIQREESKIKDERSQARKELQMYLNNLKQLEKERMEEEKLLNKLLDEHKAAIEKKQMDAKCAIIKANKELQKAVLSGRAEQIELRKKEADERLKMQQAENELMRMNWELNERLEAENARLQAEAVREYRNDLLKQIEYNEILRKREKEELERQIEIGKQEEAKYQALAAKLAEEIKTSGGKHPFRRVLEQSDCYCRP